MKKDRQNFIRAINYDRENTSYLDLLKCINEVVSGVKDLPDLDLEPLNKDIGLQQIHITLNEENFLLNQTSENIRVLRPHIKEKYHEFLIQRSGNYDITVANLNKTWPKYLGSFKITENIYFHNQYQTANFREIFREGICFITFIFFIFSMFFFFIYIL